MEKAQIEKELKEKLIDDFGIYPDFIFKDESRFTEDIGFDSLDFVELVMWAENRFDIHIKDEEVENLDTFGKVIDYLLKTIK